jgi:hypothetical protein
MEKGSITSPSPTQATKSKAKEEKFTPGEKPSQEKRIFMENVVFREKIASIPEAPYEGSEDIDRENSSMGLMVCSDHANTDPYERPSWGGIIVYMNGALQLFGVTPYNSQYFTKESLTSPNKVTEGGYLGNPRKATMWCISLVSLKEKMMCRKVDVTVVDVAEIFSTNPDNHER